MATSTTDYKIAPEDGWTSVAATSATYLRIKPSQRALRWALFIGAGAPVTTMIPSFANLSYSDQPTGGSPAFSILTLTDVAAADETVTIGSTVYTFKAAPSAAYEVLVGTAEESLDYLVAAINGATRTSEATSVLTLVGNASAGDEVVLGDKTYVFRASPMLENEVLIGSTVELTCDNLVAAINDSGVGNISATGTLTLSANVSDGDTVTIGDYVYTFKTTLTGAPFEVKIGAAATNSIDNLIAAVNSGAGVGSLYSYHTPQNPFVSAAQGAGDTLDVTARTEGLGGNGIALLESGSTTSWGAAATAGGVQSYGFNTTANEDATAADGTGTTVDVTAIAEGVAGNDVATTTDISGASFADTTLGGGTGASTPGVDFYGADTDAHPDVQAADGTGTTVEVTARLNGTAANSISTAETLGDGSWEDTTLGGGTGSSVAGVAGQTITLGSKTYTFMTAAAGLSITETANEVVMGATATLTYQNLEKAVNLTGTAGTHYGVGTEINADLVALDDGSDDISFSSRLYDGSDGDGITVGETLSNAAFDGAAVLTAGGADLTEGQIHDGDEEVEITTATDGAAYIRVLDKYGRRLDEAAQFSVLRDST